MFVKICGLTNREDTLSAIEFGALATGFVFAPSPRRAQPETIAQFIHQLPHQILRVGVFVDEAPEEIERISRLLNLDVAQLHGSETPGLHPRSLRIWRAFRVKSDSPAPPDYPEAEAILIDGASWDWTLAKDHFTRPLILAGGLNETNVASALAAANASVGPLLAVDVSSGIEASPGRKDHASMKQFIQAALRT